MLKTLFEIFKTMGNQNNEQSLKQKWKNFLNVLFDPWVLALLIMTIGLGIYFNRISSDPTSNKDVLAIFTTIITVISGLLGGMISHKWAQMTEMKVLVARGRSAIRSLKLILLNISNIEKRTNFYIKTIDHDNKEHKLIINNYQEVIEKCNILGEEIISSIENWTDIIPEVENFKTQIGVITDLKINKSDLEADIVELKKHLASVKEKATMQKEELRQELSDKEAELLRTEQKLREKENEINMGGLILPIKTFESGDNLISKLYETCASCGEIYYNEGRLANENKCPNCQNELYLGTDE